MMKAGILTYHNTRNSGAALQAYAFQKKLFSVGIDNEIIDYRCEKIEGDYHLKKIYDNKNMKELIKWVLTFRRDRKTQAKFDCFKRKYMNIGKRYDKATISNANKEYDAFITGSDQVWNMKLNGGDYTYLLDFVEKGKKRISYAASMGSAMLEERYSWEFGKELSLFDFISVREKPLGEYIEERFGFSSSLVLDPTLLLDKKDYDFKSCNKLSKDKYIFVYTVASTPRIEKAAKELAKATGYKIVWGHMSYKKKHGVKNVTDLDPVDFVNYIKNAEYVLTSSFHGMAMSIVFEKQFFYDLDTAARNNNSRLETLAENLSLENRKLTGSEKQDFDNQIEYVCVKQKLEGLKAESEAFLRTIFNREY